MTTLPRQLLPACRRHDHVLAAYVNAAATVRAFIGLDRAEDFARKAGIPDHVLLRVLIAGGPRRPHARFRELTAGPGRGGDAPAGSPVYFRTGDASGSGSVGVNKRVDERTSLIVDAAINAAASHGIAGAAAEMMDLDVPVELAFRVLCQPDARRRHALPSGPAESRMRTGHVERCRRRNHLHAAYVNAALTISASIGVQRAEAMLVRQGVAPSVILRILHLNGFRRWRESTAPAGHAVSDAEAGDSV